MRPSKFAFPILGPKTLAFLWLILGVTNSIAASVSRGTTREDSKAPPTSIVSCPCAISPLPDLSHKELTARWMVHSLDWGVLSTISSRLVDDDDAKQPVPFGNVYSFVDGPCQNSTGVPYFYGTYMDQSFKDSLTNTNAALTLSEASLSSVCLDSASGHEQQNQQQSASEATPTTMNQQACQIGVNYGDPENPVCARLTLTGKVREVKDPVEKEWALQAMFQRHESMKDWPTNHDWIVAKLELSDIWLIDFYGGASVLDLDKYFAANDFNMNNAILRDRERVVDEEELK